MEYGTKDYRKSVLAQKSGKCDGAGRDLLITGEGASGPIYCTREYAMHRLAAA